MGDFSQNGIVSTLHDFKTKSTDEIEKELLEFSKERLSRIDLFLQKNYQRKKQIEEKNDNTRVK